MYILPPFRFYIRSLFCTRSPFCRVQPQSSISPYTSLFTIAGAHHSLEPTRYPPDTIPVDFHSYRATPHPGEFITNHPRRVQITFGPGRQLRLVEVRSPYYIRSWRLYLETLCCISCWSKSCGEPTQSIPPSFIPVLIVQQLSAQVDLNQLRRLRL
jgi:hypothetical protein